MTNLHMTHKTKQRLTKAVNVFVQFTFVVYSVGFGFLAVPAAAQTTAEDVTRPDAPNPTLEQFTQQSVAGAPAAAQKVQSDAVAVELAPAAGNPLYAWDRTPNIGWSHGQISGYYETEDIPFQLELDGLSAGVSTTVSVRMEHKRGGITGFEEFRNPDATTEPGLTYNANRTAFAMSAPTPSTISGIQYKTYTFTFTPSGTTASLYWDALIALGAHNYPGASLDVRVVGAGDKTVPIATNEFLYNTFTINKFDTADPIFVGETTNYHIQFVNTGNAPATNVIVTDTLPAGLSYVSTVDSDGGTVQVNGQTITTTFASVDEGTGREIILEVRGDVAGKHTNPASVVSSFQPNPTTDTEDTTVVLGNPDLPLACGLDIGLVIDSSGSIDNTELTQMKNAYRDFVDALLVDNNTPTQFSVVEFDTNVVTPTLGFTNNATAIKNDINASVSGGWTNWEDALLESHDQYDPRADKPDLMIFASDGNPNTVGVSAPSSGGTASETTAVNAAVARANAIKTDGIRILSIAIGDQLDVPNLQAISGPTVYPDDTSNLLEADVVKTNFSQLAQDLADLAIAQCGGTITVQKLINGQPAQGWDFTANVTNGTPTPTTGTTDTNGQVTFDISDINGGTATASVIETLQAGYSVSAASCTKNQQPVGTFNGTDRVTGVTVGPNDIVSCTFSNSRDTGTIQVIKHVINDNGGTKGAADFTMNVTGTNVSTPSFPGSETGTIVTANTGAYSVDEVELPGYAKSLSAGCSGTLAKNEQKVCTITNNDVAPQLTVIKHVVNNNGGTKVASNFTMNVTGTNVSTSSFPGNEAGTTVTLNAGSYSVDESAMTGYTKALGTNCSGTIALGESKTCTITNDDNAASLTIIKHVVNNNGGTKVAGDFTMNVTGSSVSTPSFPGSEAGTVVTLNAGSYSVDESPVTGYAKSLGANCSGTIANGEQKTCTITNDDIQPKLTVTKIVTNDNGGTKQVSDFPLFVGQTSVTSGVQNGFNAGAYTVSETNLPGYTGTITGDCAANGAITLSLGDVKSCTITNNDVAPQLTVIKHVVNNNGGTKVAANFTMNVTGTNVSTPSFPGSEAGTTVTLNQGTFSVDESVMAGYAKSFGGDCTGTINVGDQKTCTITNDDIQPKLTVTKIVENDNGGTAVIADFPLHVDQTPVTSGVQNGFNVGTYTVSEVQKFGYTGTITGDCAANGTITLGIGDVKSCTITNNDIQPQLTVYKYVDNDNGGDAIPSDFTLHIDGQNTNPTEFQGSSTGTLIALDQGAYAVTEEAFAGYDPEYSNDCAGSIAVGETKTCVVTNTSQAAHIVVIKHVVNNDGGSKVAADFTMHINGVDVFGDANFPGNEAGSNRQVKPGTYNISENGPTGYSAGFSNDCSGSIALGETKFCTITNNDQPGELTVIKHVVNNNGGTLTAPLFTMNVTGTSVSDPSFPGSETGTTVTLNAGAYSVDESAMTGYAKSLGANCSGTIANGEHKTCTITNDDIQPLLTVTKVVVNDDGGDKEVSDFPLFVDATSVVSGVQNGFDAASYTISESEFTGYASEISGDCDSEGTITLHPGDVKECTITNDDIAPQLKLVKEVINNDGGLLEVSDFPLFIEDQQVTSGEWNTVSANTEYTLSETSDLGYAASAWGGDCAEDGTITLLPGDEKTCTITNNDIAGKISGYKYNTQEQPMDGWEICLAPEDVEIDAFLPTSILGEIQENCVITGSGEWPTGYYEFTDVTQGMYTVYEHVQSGWQAVDPASGEYTGVFVPLNQNIGKNFVNRQIFPDLTITKDDGKTTATPGSTLTYTMTITNDGEYLADGIFVMDTLPAHLTYVSDTSGVAVQKSGSNLMWDFPSKTLGVGESMSFTLTVTIDSIMPAGITTLTNAVVVSTESQEPNVTNNSATDNTNVAAAPVISVSKTDSPDPVAAGANLTYTIAWSVTGNAAASNVTITDVLDANLTFVSASDGGTYNAATRTVTWNLGTKTPSVNGIVTLVTTVATPLTNGTLINNTAVMDSTENDPVSDPEQTTVTSAPQLTIDKTVNASAANPGNTIAYTITVTNLAAANAIAKNVVISDTLPAGFTVKATGLGTYTLSLGDLAPGKSATTTFDVVIGTSVAAGTYTNTGIGKGDNTSEVKDAADIRVVVPQVLGVDTRATLGVNKSVDKTSVNPRGLLLYTVAVTNTGNETALNVTLTDSLPQGFTFVADGSATMTFQLGDIEPSHTRSVTYQVRVAADAKAGTYENLATATADNADKVADQVSVEVRPGRVLAATGAGTLDYALGILGALLLALGISGLVRFGKNKEDDMEETA